METYMERRLTGLHEAGSAFSVRQKVLTFVIALTILFLLPVLHLGVIYYAWAPDKPPVDELHCQCGCFDTVFRGRYESPPANYKHVYFNSTKISAKIWFVVILGIMAAHEVLRYIGQLLWRRKLRWTFFVLLLSAIYPHYYGWWGFFNYLNEEFYQQWWHQVFFSITEAISTAMVVHLCNSDSPVEPSKLLLILDINGMHILVNCLDQFINNVIFRRGQHFEAVRDIGLLLPDLFHVLVCYFELRLLAERKKKRIWNLFFREELLLSGVLVSMFSILGRNL